MISINQIINTYNKIKKLANKALKNHEFEQALRHIEAAASLAYNFNFIYSDKDLENSLSLISEKIIISQNFKPIENRVVFFDSFVLDNRGLTQQYIRSLIVQEKEILFINDGDSLLNGQLIIKEYSPGKASMSTIESHIKKCIDQDFKPDLIIIDYVDLLRSKRTNRERKDEIDDIYISTKALARELQLPVWSVSQVNRAGAKDDIIEGDKAAGSYDKMMITDLSISLSRKKEDKVNGTGRFHIMKNRYGMDGLTFQVDVNTSNGHIIIGDHYDEEADTVAPKKQSSENFDDLDRRMLANKFFELNT